MLHRDSLVYTRKLIGIKYTISTGIQHDAVYYVHHIKVRVLANNGRYDKTTHTFSIESCFAVIQEKSTKTKTTGDKTMNDEHREKLRMVRMWMRT